MICFSDSTEHGPAITINSPPPISMPFMRIRDRPALNCLLTNLYGAEIRTTFSTCGIDSTDSMHAVTSPTPTTPITTRSSPSIECTLYPKCSTIPRTASISCREACIFIEIIIASPLALPRNYRHHSSRRHRTPVILRTSDQDVRRTSTQAPLNASARQFNTHLPKNKKPTQLASGSTFRFVARVTKSPLAQL